METQKWTLEECVGFAEFDKARKEGKLGEVVNFGTVPELEKWLCDE